MVVVGGRRGSSVGDWEAVLAWPGSSDVILVVVAGHRTRNGSFISALAPPPLPCFSASIARAKSNNSHPTRPRRGVRSLSHRSVCGAPHVARTTSTVSPLRSVEGTQRSSYNEQRLKSDFRSTRTEKERETEGGRQTTKNSETEG